MLGGFSFAHQGLGYPFTQAPGDFRLGDVLGDCRVESKLCFGRCDERILKPGIQGGVIIRVRQLHQHQCRRDGPKGDASIGDVAKHEVYAGARHEFEGVRRSPHLSRTTASRECRFRIPHCDESSRPSLGFREQLQHRAGDDSERAFGADEEIAQGITGIVLAQGCETIPNATVRQGHFEAEGQFPHRAVAQHGNPARIRREITPDRAASSAPRLKGKWRPTSFAAV